MQLVLLQYNNYLNRQLKVEASIADYYDKAAAYQIIEDFDFNPADGVDTTAIIGGEYYDYMDSDYMLVVEDGSIKSRWFVIDADRQRYGQCRLKLHRDVVADGYNIWINAPAYVKTGYVSNVNNPAIFMQEQFSANQIKQSETPLYDISNSAWVVGFIKKNSAIPTGNIKVPVFYSDYETTDINTFWLQPGTMRGNMDIVSNDHYYNRYNDDSHYYKNSIVISGSSKQSVISGSKLTNVPNYTLTAQTNPIAIKNKYLQAYGTIGNLFLQMKNMVYTYETIKNELETRNIQLMNSKVVKDTTTNKYYKYTTSLSNYTTANMALDTTNMNLLRQYFTDVSATDTNAFKVNYKFVYIYVLREEISESELSWGTLIGETNTDFPLALDAPYSIFFMPYDSVICSAGQSSFTTNRSLQQTIATAITKSLGEKVMDLMVLPYCPLQSRLGTGTFNYNGVKRIEFKTTTAGNVLVSAIFFAELSSFNGQINTTISCPTDSIEFKAQNDLKTYRLCSSGYASAFEFNAAKNYGVDYFTFTCTYKPYTPYIKIAPNFKGLYGQQFSDPRGLILTGDFSLPIENDAWTNYQINNKNYQNSFDRQMANMEVNRKYQRLEQLVGGQISAIGQGVQVGAMTGNWFAGGAASAASGLANFADVAISEKLYQESKSLAQDQFNFQIDNIKALPIGLVKVSGWNYDSDYVPFLEIYDCTEEEKEAYKNLLKYNGMTINRIGKFSDYLNANDETYIRGTVIRLEDINDDYHVANALRQELEMGVFV